MCHLLVNCIACELSGNLLQRNWTKNLGLVPPSTVKWYKLHFHFLSYFKGRSSSKQRSNHKIAEKSIERKPHAICLCAMSPAQIPQETLAVDERNWACSPCEIIKVDPSCNEQGTEIVKRWKECKTFWSWGLEGKEAWGASALRSGDGESEHFHTHTVVNPFGVLMHFDMFRSNFLHAIRWQFWSMCEILRLNMTSVLPGTFVPSVCYLVYILYITNITYIFCTIFSTFST